MKPTENYLTQITDFFSNYPAREIADEFHSINFYLQSSKHFDIFKGSKADTTRTLQLVEDICRKLYIAIQKRNPSEIIVPLVYELKQLTCFEAIEPFFWVVIHGLNDSKDFESLEDSKKAYKTGLIRDLRMLIKGLFNFSSNIQVLNMN